MVAALNAKEFAKEMATRKRLAGIFNKSSDEFPTLKEYNDYLEEVEDMIWKLIEGVDVAVIEAKIARYEAENAEQIINSHARKAEQLAADFAASKGPLHADTEMAVDLNSQTGLSMTTQGQYAPALAGGQLMQPRPMGMTPQPAGGPDLNLDDEERMRRGARAGGWTPEFNRKRALEEAFGSLWV